MAGGSGTVPAELEQLTDSEDGDDDVRTPYQRIKKRIQKSQNRRGELVVTDWPGTRAVAAHEF